MVFGPDMEDRRHRQDQACRAADEFSKLFYETLDKRRHLLSNLYVESAILVWNGNPYNGKESITKFYETLPLSSTEIRAVDAHPILDEMVQGQTTLIVTVSGNIKYKEKYSLFSESFLLTAQSGGQGNVWKISSDCFRFHEPVA